MLNSFPSLLQFKPLPEEEDCYVRPLPDCPFSVRIWGKHLENQYQYCLDFIVTATGEQINTPKGYELWTVPNKKTPFALCPAGRLYSVDRGAGAPRGDLDAIAAVGDSEKYLLMEGMACRLIRPGMKNIYFEVPIRPRAQQEDDDVVIKFD